MTEALALVVAAGSAELFERCARTLDGVDLHWVRYGSEAEIRPGVANLLATTHIDAIYFGGPMAYDRSREALPAMLPVKVGRTDALDLALAYLEARGNGWAAGPITIDTFDEATVEEVNEAVGLGWEKVSCLPYAPDQSVDEIVDHHLGRGSAGAEGYAITGRSAVAERLDGRMRYIKVLSAPSTIRAGLAAIALEAHSRRSEELRFAAGVFTVLADAPSSAMDRARVGLVNVLLNAPAFADAWVHELSRGQVVVFAHKALFEEATDGWVASPVIGAAEESLGVRVAAGFGLGQSARTSVGMAEQAARRAERDGGGCAYLMGEGGIVVGPITDAARRLEFRYREHGPRLDALAREAGLSPTTLSRLVAVERQLRGRAVSPVELAEMLRVTGPTGRRLIRALAGAGLVAEAGISQSSGPGRPSHVFRLQVADALVERGAREPKEGATHMSMPGDGADVVE